MEGRELRWSNIRNVDIVVVGQGPTLRCTEIQRRERRKPSRRGRHILVRRAVDASINRKTDLSLCEDDMGGVRRTADVGDY